jgi:hypothetical protein
MALLSEAELVAALPDLAGRADLAALLDTLTAAITRYCGRALESGSQVETFRGDVPRPALWLVRLPVTAVTSITVNGQALAPTSYTLDTTTGELLRGAYPFLQNWPGRKCPVVATYTGGFATVPSDVKRAAILLAQDLVDAAGRLKSEHIGDYKYETQGSFATHYGLINSDVAMLLRPYRVFSAVTSCS